MRARFFEKIQNNEKVGNKVKKLVKRMGCLVIIAVLTSGVVPCSALSTAKQGENFDSCVSSVGQDEAKAQREHEERIAEIKRDIERDKIRHEKQMAQIERSLERSRLRHEACGEIFKNHYKCTMCTLIFITFLVTSSIGCTGLSIKF